MNIAEERKNKKVRGADSAIMQIVIESAVEKQKHRWKLETLPEKKVLFDSDSSFATSEECLEDLRRNVEAWTRRLSLPARTPIAETKVLYKTDGAQSEQHHGKVRDLWPQLFDRVV